MSDRSPLGFLQELKRRKVVRATLAYVAAAFVGLQGVDLLAAGLDMPAWVLRSMTILAVVGLPVTMVVAWLYDVTPDGLRRTPDGRTPDGFRRTADAGETADGNIGSVATDGPQRPRGLRTAPRLRMVVVALVVMGGLGSGGWWAAQTLNASDDVARFLAVLPFENISEDEANAHFAAGMRAEVMGHLSRMAEIRLLSTASIAAMEASSDRVSRLAAEVGVGSVLEGSIRMVGARARIDVQLTDTRTGRVFWTAQYDREVSDVLAVQTDIALRVARELRARLSPEERAMAQRPPTRDPAAYEVFLHARQIGSGSRDRLIASGELYRQAARMDTTFALALAHLARTRHFLFTQGDLAALDSGFVIVRRALAIDPELPYGWFTLAGLLALRGQYDDAIAAYERAHDLDPNATGPLNDLSITLALIGRYDESLYSAERALQRAPNLANNYYHVGVPLVMLGDDAVTERFLLEGLTQQPNGYHRVHLLLATVELLTGRADAAVARMAAEAEAKPTLYEVRQTYSEMAEFARHPAADSFLEEFAPQHLDAFAWFTPQSNRTRLARVLLERGDTDRANRMLDQALARAMRAIDDGSGEPEQRLDIAAVHALRGDRDVAIQWVRHGYDAGYRWYRGLELAPSYASLRDMPEFREILDLMARDVARMRRNAAARSDLFRAGGA